MKIDSTEKMELLSQMLLHAFGEVPTNLIIVSPEIITEAKTYMDLGPNAHDLKFMNISIVEDYAEITH